MIAATYAIAVAALALALIITGMIYRHLWEQGWRVHGERSARYIGRGSWPLGVTVSGNHFDSDEYPFAAPECYQLNITIYLFWLCLDASVELIQTAKK